MTIREVSAIVPLTLPYRHEFRDGFVLSASEMTREKALELLECQSFYPHVEGLTRFPIFRYCPMRPTFSRDVVEGQPTDQNAAQWDYPCGIKLAHDPHAVYGCIDRELRGASAWRKLDDSGWILAVRSDEYLLACEKVKP
jgi:hypothetical protein